MWQISCDVQLKVSSQSQKESQKLKLPSEFEVEPSSKVAIPSHSHIYATVSFKPTAMQVGRGLHEVTICLPGLVPI